MYKRQGKGLHDKLLTVSIANYGSLSGDVYKRQAFGCIEYSHGLLDALRMIHGLI